MSEIALAAVLFAISSAYCISASINDKYKNPDWQAWEQDCLPRIEHGCDIPLQHLEKELLKDAVHKRLRTRTIPTS